MRNCAFALLLSLTGIVTATSAADPNQSRDEPSRARGLREPPGKTASDREAAKATRSDLAKERALPLAWTSGDPQERKQLRAIRADEAGDPYKRFNAARVLVYLGDRQSIDMLSKVLEGKLVQSAGGREQNQAALCLLYLDYEFPNDFAFSRLPSPLYPELDVLIRRRMLRVDPSPPYTREDVEVLIVRHIGLPFSTDVCGPLSVGEWEEGARPGLERNVIWDGLENIPRVRAGNRMWEGFKRQLQQGDPIFFFRSDKTSWAGLYGSEGYVAIRNGEVVASMITKLN